MTAYRKFKSDADDLAYLVYLYGDFTRCDGGRQIHRMYCCPHCGSVNPSEECDAPKPKDKQ